MCAGAIDWSQIKRVYYACADEKKGFTTYNPGIIPNRVEVNAGLLEKESRDLLKTFFKSLREQPFR
jgi:tRNA(adenine34) deaminase